MNSAINLTVGLAMTKETWQVELSQAITDPEKLLAALALDHRLLPAATRATKLFPLKVTPSFLQRMKPGDTHDPLLKQILPLDLELNAHPGFITDPLQEQQANPIPGLLHKYHGRVLLIATGACAIHCRYCFRRHFPYADNVPNSTQWQQAIDYIANDQSIEEVILSGGDPLVLKDRHLEALLTQIEGIAHVTRLRIHTRLPIVLPSRVTTTLCELLMQSRLSTALVVHSNHANELNNEVCQALKKLIDANVSLLNQAVLLKGINDTVSAQLDLNKKLFAFGVLPYYLHLPDKVQNTAHFDVSMQEARQLLKKLHGQLPGYLLPRLAQEVPGADAKRVMA